MISTHVLLHQEREERILRMRRQHPDDRPSYGYQPSQRDDVYKAKRQRPNSRLPPGELCGMCLGWLAMQ